MSSVTQRKAQSGGDVVTGLNASSTTNQGSGKFKDRPPTFKYQKIFARVVLSSAVFIIVYFTSKKDKVVTLAGINEFIQLREHKFDCLIESYSIEPDNVTPCIAASCGRFASDKILTETELEKLTRETKRILLRNSVGEINEESSLTVELNEDQHELNSDIKSLLPKLFETLSQRFDVPYDSIALSQSSSFLARITNITTEFSERLHTQHHDTEADKTTKFSFFIFLSTFKKDFSNGKLVYVDIEKGKKRSSVVESKSGRIVGFTAGGENNYSFEKIGHGSLFFIKLSFSCKL